MSRLPVRALGAALAALALVAAAAFAAHAFALKSGLERLRGTAQHRLDIIATQLEHQQARFDFLPSLLEMTPSVPRLLAAPGDAALRDAVNRTLQGINATAGAANLYVLDGAGRGLAASDWAEPGTPIGADLSFRPYVRDALARGRGSFYGVGITSKRAGYYLSYALFGHGGPPGIAAVKVDLEDTEATWAELPGAVLVADERAVVILSTRPAWKFRPLGALGRREREEIAAMRPYGDATLQPIAWTLRRPIDAQTDLRRIEGNTFLASARRVHGGRWQLVVLDDVAPVESAARLGAITAGLAMAVLCLGALVVRQRRRGVRAQLASRAALQAAHDGLEAQVASRTTELRQANAQLGAEVEARKAIEADLRVTQHELVHAGKMAALGQMSAGLVHELNQPLAAMRTLSDNACVLLEQQRTDDVRANLQRIAHLVDRLGRLTHPLKAFAHKGGGSGAAVSVRQAVAHAQFVVSQRLREQGVEFSVEVVPPGLAAQAEEARLEQVLVNLFGNAIDALADAQVRQLRVQAHDAGGRCSIAVSDSGPGIRADILARLFEPFTTSKPAGTGLGLGLMISAHIVRELGGSLRAHNHEQGGARFVVDLPLAEPPGTGA